MEKPILVCCDRDGTINRDEKSYFGRSSHWKEQIVFLPGVIEGVKLLNNAPNTHIFIITNQAGVAIKGPKFDELTEERMHEVNEEIIERLKEKNALVEGYFACPFVSENYVKNKELQEGHSIDEKYLVKNNPDRKPDTGMVKKAAEAINSSIEECEIYFIGDKDVDIKTALNSNGIGILVLNKETLEDGDLEKVEELAKKHPEEVFVFENFLDAAKFISRRTGKQS